MMLLREEFLTVDSEHYSIYLSQGNGVELPPIPGFYDIAAAAGGLNRKQDPHESLYGISIAEHAIGIYVSCDTVRFPIRLESWDSPPDDLDADNLEEWLYVAEVSFDLSQGELYIHGLLTQDAAKPIYVAPDTYRIRVYLGQLDSLAEEYILTHWMLDDYEYEFDEIDQYGEEVTNSQFADPELNGWCRLVLWPNPFALPCDILAPKSPI